MTSNYVKELPLAMNYKFKLPRYNADKSNSKVNYFQLADKIRQQNKRSFFWLILLFSPFVPLSLRLVVAEGKNLLWICPCLLFILCMHAGIKLLYVTSTGTTEDDNTTTGRLNGIELLQDLLRQFVKRSCDIN